MNREATMNFGSAAVLIRHQLSHDAGERTTVGNRPPEQRGDRRGDRLRLWLSAFEVGSSARKCAQ